MGDTVDPRAMVPLAVSDLRREVAGIERHAIHEDWQHLLLEVARAEQALAQLRSFAMRLRNEELGW